MAVRVGIVGCGMAAEVSHLPWYHKCRSAKIVSLCDTDTKRARLMASGYKAENVFADWREMLARARIDAVSVCLPNHLHREVSVAAARAGKHILVEKPMATSMEDAREMVQAARENRVILMVVEAHRFFPVNEVARQLVARGRIGKLHTVRCRMSHAGPEDWSPTGKWFFYAGEAGGGAMIDMGTEAVDLIRFLTPEPVDEVASFLTTREKEGNVDDNAVAILRFRNGTLGVVEASWTTRPGLTSLEVYGSKGRMEVKSGRGKPSISLYLEKPRRLLRPRLPSASRYRNPGAYFIRCIGRKEKPFISGEEGLKNLEVLLAAYQSARDDKVVSLPLD